MQVKLLAIMGRNSRTPTTMGRFIVSYVTLLDITGRNTGPFVPLNYGMYQLTINPKWTDSPPYIDIY